MQLLATTAAVLSLAGAALAQTGIGSNTTTITEIVAEYTTVCPPGTHTINGNVVVAESTTTITISDCPCTITRELPVVPTLPVATGGWVGAPAPSPVLVNAASVRGASGLAVAFGAIALMAAL